MATKSYIFFLFLLLLFNSCRKECVYQGNFRRYGCGANQYVPSAKYYSDYATIGNGNYLINDSTQYDTLFNGKIPIDSIDFSNNTLLVQAISTGEGREYGYLSTVCLDFAGNKGVFYTEYELKNQCKGSGIKSMRIMFLALVPKISNTFQIEYITKDANPF